MEIKAFNKGLKVISSCKNYSQIRGAYNYVHNYRILFGKTKLWKDLYNFCGRKREMLGDYDGR
tara:strand:- start:2353 stop:2541 length:189 start_codon:yes stop_codon:yes gene_type:complete